MADYFWFLITIAVGAAGAFLAIKAKIPAGGILGAMFAVVLLNVISNDSSQFYTWAKLAVQLSIGALAGARVGRSELKRIMKIPIPLCIVLAMEIVCTVIFGVIISRICSIDKITSLYLVAPGGLTDIMLIAEDAGVDSISMVAVQLLRVVVFNAIFPPIFCAIVGRENRKNRSEQPTVAPRDEESDNIGRYHVVRLIGLFLFSGVGGMLVRMTGIEGGAIIGSMLFSIIYSCIFGKSVVPVKVKRCQQALLGTYIGTGISLSTLFEGKYLILPVLLVGVCLFVETFVTAWLVRKTKKLDRMSCLTSSCPGGLAEMLMLTDELNGDVSNVAVIHSFRLVFIVTVFPPLLRFISGLI